MRPKGAIFKLIFVVFDLYERSCDDLNPLLSNLSFAQNKLFWVRALAQPVPNLRPRPARMAGSSELSRKTDLTRYAYFYFWKRPETTRKARKQQQKSPDMFYLDRLWK